MITIGILNVQGAVSEHYDVTKTAVENMNIEAKVESVRYADEVAKCDGIIISGGESTVIGKIIQRRGIDTVIKENNIPVFGTCAGMVLLAKKTDFDQPLIGLMDIDVERNAFGRQKDSFESMLSFLDEDYLGVFIRAPAVKDYDKSKDNIQVLSELDGKVVAIKQDHNMAIAFHPELTDDTRIHEYFIQEILDCVV
ncbi:pyridoxal 5'-phosphate synthase glutaminase subunit PdxT [Methanobrevibacter woesei]|uniref:pyridoxal 5'-phosphate synthase glutaminase subunit PdxT n=1 Tax=Methanobrevibacter woesei TaxID=190976 RepID=UPI0039F60E62